jgi:hypothetical protein
MKAIWECLRRELVGKFLIFEKELFFEENNQKCSALVAIHIFREKPLRESFFNCSAPHLTRPFAISEIINFFFFKIQIFLYFRGNLSLKQTL